MLLISVQVGFLGYRVVVTLWVPELVLEVYEVLVFLQLRELTTQIHLGCLEWSVVDDWEDCFDTEGGADDSLPELLVPVLFEEQVVDNVEERGVVCHTVHSLLNLLVKSLE